MSTWYIGPSGNDTTGDGSLGNPYLTVSKCLIVGANGDTIKALTGTYIITNTTNVNKQVVITSNSGVKTDVIFSSNCTIFNLQESNISITYVTLQTSAVTELVSIDRMSTSTTVPTFWTGNVINNCNIKYVTVGLSLNGAFTVTSNTFTRNSGTNTADIIKIYSSRGSCGISSNIFTDSSNVQYVIHLTSTGSGSYLDRCNSKGGNLTVTNNTLTFTGALSSIFIINDYFNQFSYGTIGPDTQYNPNTRLLLNVNNNNLSYITKGRLIDVNTISNSDFSMFGVCNINTNTIDNTDYGAVHLNKNTTSHTALTVSSSDLNRPIFKIYSNTLNTIQGSFDLLSAGALTGLICCYSLKRRLMSYTGPVINVKRSTDNISSDFYASVNGDLNTALDMSGTSLATWLSGATGYIFKWYNQSGKTLMDAVCGPDNRFVYPQRYMRIATDGNGKYYLDGTNYSDTPPAGPSLHVGDYATGNYNQVYTYFTGNKEVTHSVKVNTLAKTGVCRFFGGGTNATAQCMGMSYNQITVGGNGSIGCYEYGNIMANTSNLVPLTNSVLTVKYDKTKVYGYKNSVLLGSVAYSSYNTIAGNYLTINGTFASNNENSAGSFYHIYMFNVALSDTDRLIMETF